MQDFVFDDNDLAVKDATFLDDEDYQHDDNFDLGSGPEDGIFEGSGQEVTTTLSPERPVFPPGQGGEYPGKFQFHYTLFQFQFHCFQSHNQVTFVGIYVCSSLVHL